MILENRRLILSALLPLFLLSAGLASSTAEAQSVAKIPNFVLTDNTGDVVGVVAGFQKLGEVSITMDDPNPNVKNDIPIQITYNNGFQFDGPENVYYTGASCSGIAYIVHINSSSRAMSRWLGRTYGVGPTPGTFGLDSQDVVVFRGSNLEANPQPTIQTRFSGNTCVSASLPGGQKAAVANAIINITTLFGDPDNWTLE